MNPSTDDHARAFARALKLSRIMATGRIPLRDLPHALLLRLEADGTGSLLVAASSERGPSRRDILAPRRMIRSLSQVREFESE